jgi:hypothetical protein
MAAQGVCERECFAERRRWREYARMRNYAKKRTQYEVRQTERLRERYLSGEPRMILAMGLRIGARCIQQHVDIREYQPRRLTLSPTLHQIEESCVVIEVHPRLKTVAAESGKLYALRSRPPLRQSRPHCVSNQVIQRSTAHRGGGLGPP